MPTTTETARGIQLKEGSFSFPPNFKCRVDTKAFEEIPRKFEICRQGIEALGDLFYEVPPEEKEGVLVQKAIWENIAERIPELGVFNASSTYTNLGNQMLPLRISLPQNRQYFPVDSSLSKEPTNPFHETKKFARELLDIVAAIKTLREEKLFQYNNFHLYPGKEAFVIRDSDTGERHITIGMHSLVPADIDETVKSEDLSIRAIKELVQERWDKREFRKLLKANDLGTMVQILRHLSRDIPTLEMVCIRTAYAAVYSCIGFIIFSILMFLTGLTPLNRPVLENIRLEAMGKGEYANNRIVLNVGEEAQDNVQVIGTYRAPLRLEKMLGISAQLDRLYHLDYEQPLKEDEFKFEPKIDALVETNFVVENGQKRTFHLLGKKRGRERFTIIPPKEAERTRDGAPVKVASQQLELLVLQPEWVLDVNYKPAEISFQQAEVGSIPGGGYIGKEIRVFANPPKDKTNAVGVSLESYFVSRVAIPMEIHYLRDPKGDPVATIAFEEFDPKGKPKEPKVRSINLEDDEEEAREGDERPRPRPRPPKKKPAKTDIDELEAQPLDSFELAGMTFYRLPKLPSKITIVRVAVRSGNLPTNKVEGSLHIAVPGISQPMPVSLVFVPKEKVEFDVAKIPDRDQVTGLAYPIQLRKQLWTEAPKKVEPNEYSQFTFHIQDSNPVTDGYGALGLGLQLQEDPRTLYFYNTANGETRVIRDYNFKENTMYFTPKAVSYQEAPNKVKVFEELDKKDFRQFRIREDFAKSANQLYAVILTDKNVENAKLTLTRGGEVAAELPLTARSKEALRVVQWKSDTSIKGLTAYGREDWREKVDVQGPLGEFRYQAIIFSGEQPDKDVSDQVYVSIKDPQVANCLYQTIDQDWFANLEQADVNLKLLKAFPGQLTFCKEPGREKYFRAEQEIIGKVFKYLVVPGQGIKYGDANKETELMFFYPPKGMEATIKVNISCAAQKQVEWTVKLDEEKKVFTAKVDNYPKAQAAKLAKKLQFVATCASVTLLHKKYHRDGVVHLEDQRWAETVRWSLEGAGFRYPPLAPPVNILGKQGEVVIEAIRTKNEAKILEAYQMMREALLLAWSPQTQALLEDHLQLKALAGLLAKEESVSRKTFDLKIQPETSHPLPPLVGEPERFVSVTLAIPFDKLLLDKQSAQIFELAESYYYGVPKNFAQAPEATELLKELYPFPASFAKQTNIVERANVAVSDMLYQNLLRDSLWEKRLKDFHKADSKFWMAMMAVSPQIADVEGKIDYPEVNTIAAEIQKQLSTYFVTPLEIRRVHFSEIQDKVRGESDKNRESLGKEEVSGLLRFVERSMMSQYTDAKTRQAWYANFTFVVDRLMLERCPWGGKWIYIKSYREAVDGTEVEPVKLYLFRRNGLDLDAYPSQAYSVNITKEETNYHLINVEGLTAFQEWFIQHPSRELKASKVTNRLRLRLFYEEGGVEKEITRPGEGGPPMIDFEAHPASILLFEVSGYHISADRIRQLARDKDFTILTTKEKMQWIWKFSFDNGPILSPFAYHIEAKPYEIQRVLHTLNWKQSPAPEEGLRSLDALSRDYRLEFVYVDINTSLPDIFAPYYTLKDICQDYDRRMISPNRTVELLSKFFDMTDQIPGASKFTWSKELTEYYKEDRDAKQMFRYGYKDSHTLNFLVPEIFDAPKDFKGTHPKLEWPRGRKTTVIWRIIPIKGDQVQEQPGFPKYIMEKEHFPNSEPVINKY